MNSSARNQWTGKVVSVHFGAVTAEILVCLNGGAEIVASTTMSSARRLGLESGQAVLVLMKASMVILALDFEGYALSARNQLAGDIIEIKLGDITADVTLKLEGGDLVTASITRESFQTLGLAVGQSALALFKSGSVVLATRR